METVQISFTFKEGTKPQDIAQKLRWHAGLLEGLSPKDAASIKNTSGAEVAEDEKLDSVPAPRGRPAKGPKTAKQRIAAAFGAGDDVGPLTDANDDIPVEDDSETETADDDFTDAPATKAEKGPVINLKDVNEACKAKMQAEGGGKSGREAVLAILKKKFKTQTLSDLDADQYAAVVKAMQV